MLAIQEQQATIQQAMQLQGQGKLTEAESIYNQLLQNYPHDPDVRFLKGTVLIRQQRFKESLPLLKFSYEVDKSHPNYGNMYGVALSKTEQVDDALQVFSETFALNSKNTKAMSNCIELALKEKRFEFAEKFLDPFMQQFENNADLRWLYAQAIVGQTRYEEAIPHMQYVMDHHPKIHEEMLNFYAACCLSTYDRTLYDTLMQTMERLKVKHPKQSKIWNQISAAYAMIGDYGSAIKTVEDSQARFGKNLENMLEHGVFSLTHTNLEEGFDGYRAQHSLARNLRANVWLPAVFWRGQDLKGKKIFISTEQGVGDFVMWAGLVPYLVEQGAEVHLGAPPVIQDLVRRAFPNMKVMSVTYTLSDDILDAGYDYYCKMSDLMEYVLPHFSPSSRPSFLKTDEDVVAKRREKYLAAHGAKRLIGISWHTVNSQTGYRRRISLDKWKDLFKLHKDTQFVSLQYDGREDELAEINKVLDIPIIHDPEVKSRDDILDWGNQIAAMDEVITIQNATAHMGGGLGVPTTLLLSSYGCWRWGTLDTNKWYQSVNIYRQQPFESWDKVMARLVEDRKGGES
ncbi:MAG: hypothetical protein MRY32_09395 [Rickettsiales bacterium]|nr:hypothetical protein [Rickettsiales bacterium]